MVGKRGAVSSRVTFGGNLIRESTEANDLAAANEAKPELSHTKS